MKRILLTTLLSAALVLPAVAFAQSSDPALDARLKKLEEELRCLVCQNQSLADSHADLAIDLRNQVRAMMKEGRSDGEIKTFMTERYGDFVLYRPPVKASTWVLWVGPFVLLAAAVAGLFAYLRRRRVAVAAGSAQLTADQQARARALLDGVPPR